MAQDLPHAMAFIHPGNLIPTFRAAEAYAGEGGRVATLEDLIRLRSFTDETTNDWYTTHSAEYIGKTRGGNLIMIVAHGIGPLATAEGMRGAYEAQSKHPKSAATISSDLFQRLESGMYGNVTVRDAPRHLTTKRFFARHDFEENQYLRDLLGSEWEEYVGQSLVWKETASKISGRYNPDEPILKVERTFHGQWLLSDRALANVLVLERAVDINEAVAITTISCQEIHTMAKMIGVRDKRPLKKVHDVVSFDRIEEMGKEAQAGFDRYRQHVGILSHLTMAGLKD